MTVGIPRALLFHYFGDLLLGFFAALKVKAVISPESNREIIRRGIALSVDEACFSSKVYLGHVDWLLGKCDMIFVPRMENTAIREDLCPRIIGVYDLVKHTFPNAKILHADTNYLFRKTNLKAFVSIGEQLGFSAEKSTEAFNAGMEILKTNAEREISAQEKLFENDRQKVLMVSHAYNLRDAIIGRDIVNFFKKQNIDVIFADVGNKKNENRRIYWKVNAELNAGVDTFIDRVDGVVLISTFPCGPDSIFNEMIIRTVKSKPVLSLTIDELDANAGILTRLESFTDILGARRG
jgi:predicted nucleotide-binding protein (sugar kinase/HSP70/actin superfamily)